MKTSGERGYEKERLVASMLLKTEVETMLQKSVRPR